MNLVLIFQIWLFVLAVCFGFSKMWLLDLSRFDLDSGFSFEMDSQKNETSLRWILWIQISQIALTNMFLFSFRFKTKSKQKLKPNQVKLKLNLVLDSVNLASDSVTNWTYLKVHPHYAAWQNAIHYSFAARQKLLGICRQFDRVQIKKEFFAKVTKTVEQDQWTPSNFFL